MGTDRALDSTVSALTYQSPATFDPVADTTDESDGVASTAASRP